MSVDLIKGYFDNASFNKEFNEYTQQRKDDERKKETEKLNQLNKVIYRKKISEMSLSELMSNWKSSWLGVLNDIIHVRLNPTILFVDDRLFFIGITLIIIIILFVLYYLFLNVHEYEKDTNINISFNIPKVDKNIFEKILERNKN